jgi:hypothetical protein
MYSDLYDPSGSSIFERRLQQAEQKLKTAKFSTLEECQAELHSTLNQIFALGNRMSPLKPVAPGPAVPGDVQGNLLILNDDAQAVVSQLLDTESSAAELLNLIAATQNTLRQQIRESVFRPTGRSYTEAFLTSGNLVSSTATVDFGAGLAALPLIQAFAVSPASFRIGPASSGQATTDEAYLLDEDADTAFLWKGERLELIFEFSQPEIVNRIQIELDDYAGLKLEELTSSPDGTLREDLIADLFSAEQKLDSASCKFSGDVILDFNPRQVKRLRILLLDLVGKREIGLRGVSFWKRQYQSSGLVQSIQMDSPSGWCSFHTEQKTVPEYTSITHLLSGDGVHYHAIQPDEPVEVPSPFWYRALLERIDDSFDNPAAQVGDGVPESSNYTVSQALTKDLGAGLLERTILFSRVSGKMLLKDTPLPGTLVVFAGSSLASASVYTLNGRQLNFLSELTDISIRYQASSLARSGMATLKQYYSPYLYTVRLEKQ